MSIRRCGASWLRHPLCHFVLIGALCWWAIHGSTSPVSAFGHDPERSISIDAPRIAELAAGWRAATGQTPSEARLRIIIDDAIEEEMLVREALRHGLDRTPVVRRRLSDVGRLLELAEDPAEAEAGARLLGLERRDPVARRYMASAMIERLRAKSRPMPSGDAAIEARLNTSPDRYTAPPTIRLSHVFVAGHDGDSIARAQRLHRSLIDTNSKGEAADRLGDPFYGGQHFPPWPPARVAAALGSEIAGVAAGLEPHRWSAPVDSPYGQHILWVEAVSDTPVSDNLRRQIAREIDAEREEALLASALDTLRKRYSATVDPPIQAP